jgi:hypothetical protein
VLLAFLAATVATAAAAAATPAVAAGQVFIPVAGHHVLGSRVAYRTEVWVTNPGQAEAQAVARFVEQGADGTAPHAGDAVVTVAAGATVLLAKVASNGEGGMLEVSSAAALEVRARLDALPASDAVDGIEMIADPDAIDSRGSDRSHQPWSSAAIQAVSAAGVLAAGEVAHLQGLGHQPGGEVTDLGLINLSEQAARCQVSAFASDGSRLGAPATVSLPPLGTLQLEDAFGSLGEQRLSGGRFEVTCDQAVLRLCRGLRGRWIGGSKWSPRRRAWQTSRRTGSAAAPSAAAAAPVARLRTPPGRWAPGAQVSIRPRNLPARRCPSDRPPRAAW